MTTKKRYVYENVEVTKIVDGDTIDVMIDLGFDSWKKARIRFFGINAPETKGEEKLLGLESKEYLTSLIPVGSIIKLETLGLDKYGRWLGVILKDELNINEHMVSKGKATEYLL